MLGVNHFDPKQPQAVVKTLDQLQLEYDQEPVFAAVEADKQLHEDVSRQKAFFLEILSREWPSLTETELAMLSASFLFEPEAHKQVWKDLPIVWLDAGRVLKNQRENHHAIHRINLLKILLNGKSLHNSLELISEIVWRAANPKTLDLNRSHTFYDRTLDAIKHFGGKWSFAVVGAGHADESREGTMANLLAGQQGISVQCHVLQ